MKPSDQAAPRSEVPLSCPFPSILTPRHHHRIIGPLDHRAIGLSDHRMQGKGRETGGAWVWTGLGEEGRGARREARGCGRGWGRKGGERDGRCMGVDGAVDGRKGGSVTGGACVLTCGRGCGCKGRGARDGRHVGGRGCGWKWSDLARCIYMAEGGRMHTDAHQNRDA